MKEIAKTVGKEDLTSREAGAVFKVRIMALKEYQSRFGRYRCPPEFMDDEISRVTWETTWDRLFQMNNEVPRAGFH